MAEKISDKKCNVLVGCTGSVASIKIPEIVDRLIKLKYDVKLVCTDKACHFFDRESLPDNVTVYTDTDEWKTWSKRGDPVLHIELRRWADIMVIAPLDANTMGKIANGICDNILTCVVRAWDVSRPLLYAPAMNTQMWLHPITKDHRARLTQWGYREIEVVEKTLMCGDKGAGAMAEVSSILEILNEERSKLTDTSHT